jgi:hypothetical protein
MDAGFSEKIMLDQKVRPPIDPIRHERAAHRLRRLPGPY